MTALFPTLQSEKILKQNKLFETENICPRLQLLISWTKFNTLLVVSCSEIFPQYYLFVELKCVLQTFLKPKVEERGGGYLPQPAAMLKIWKHQGNHHDTTAHVLLATQRYTSRNGWKVCAQSIFVQYSCLLLWISSNIQELILCLNCFFVGARGVFIFYPCVFVGEAWHARCVL